MHAKRAQRGRPTLAASQRDKILALLKQAGSEGVRREDLIFQYRWTQAGTRIFELEQMGYKIRHESRVGERLVVYVLESEPLKLKPLPEGRDWYEAQFGARPSPKKPGDLGPLFARGDTEETHS